MFGLQQAHWLVLCPRSRVKWTAGVPTLLGWLPVGIITPKAGGRQEDKRQEGLTPAPELPSCLGIHPRSCLETRSPVSSQPASLCSVQPNIGLRAPLVKKRWRDPCSNNQKEERV